MHDIGVRIFHWCKRSGAQRTALTKPAAKMISDTMHSIHLDLWNIRKTSMRETGMLCRYLSRLHRSVEVLAFQCGLHGLAIDTDGLLEIQSELKEAIDNLLNYPSDDYSGFTHRIGRPIGGILTAR